jgi:hypothetical protein
VERRRLTEHWTNSRRALVLDGSPEVIEAIAKSLSIPTTRSIAITPHRAVLGLWDEHLWMYVRGNSLRQANANGHRSIYHSGHDAPFQGCNQVIYDRQSES